MTIFTAPLFKKHFQKLPRDIQEKAKLKDEVFRQNPFHPSLETHKLHGKHGNEWAYSVNYKYRIIFYFLKDDSILYTNIGTHDELY